MTEVNRGKAPQPLAPVPFNVPDAFRTTLPNGLRLVVLEDRRLPLVSFRLAFMSGDIDDPADNIGLTSAVASMLTEGTESYTSAALAEKIERLGASISASASDDFTIISASSLSLYSSEILQLLAEIIFRPTFPENELDLYRRNTIEHLKFQRSQPNFLASEQTARVLYGDHPYSRVSPKAGDIEKLNRNQLATFHRQRFIPNNAVMIAVGDVERVEFMKEIESLFGAWQTGDADSHIPDAPIGLEKRKLTIVDRPGSAQANIVLAALSIRRDHPDYFPLLVMNQVLGAGASSRVFMNLREEKGYTYGAYTRIDAKKLAGDFEATAEVRTAVTGDSLKEFLYELNRIRGEDVSDAELTDAKNFLAGVFPIRAETQEGLTNLILSQELYGLPADYLQTYRDNVSVITSADVRRVAEQYIRPDKMSLVIVGDAGEILDQVSGFAEDVEVYDTENNALDLAYYTANGDQETVDLSGNWKLSLDFQGQQLPITMVLEQAGGQIAGKLETALGTGTISAGSVSGGSFTATAITEIQGEDVEFQISGRLRDGKMSGTLFAPIVPDPLTFRGSRAIGGA